MAPDADDELARTATVAAGEVRAPSSSALAEPASGLAPGLMIGRYRLERELGTGGMGVVHVAFDPDLERRVALKVLRTGGDDAARRLLREARAMARLTHPNVVTVHEVGTAGGRDYVAMELVEGTTLAEWLRTTRRHPREIVAAFVAAGRGLAAAHDAGIVHRDFKPHNVLRSHGGRIAVTDFGLARETILRDAADPLATTLPGSATAAAISSTPSVLAGLTMTGALLGTPAYMAPEQWDGGEVTPASDQFAFCVALWEALAGERPYRGATLDELRANVQSGTSSLEMSAIPRRLRALLVRGLDPDPAKRWPSMHVLLDRLVRLERRSGLVLGLVGVALAAVGVLVYLLAGPSGARACALPALEPAVVWAPEMRERLLARGQQEAVRLVDQDVARWQAERERACSAEPVARAQRLACLDGVLARLDAVVRAADALDSSSPIDVGAYLVDPAVCAASSPPRLARTLSPQVGDVIAAVFRQRASRLPLEAAEAEAVVARAAGQPCALALAHARALSARVTDERHIFAAEQEAERCDDDRVRAEVALAIAEHAFARAYLTGAQTDRVRRAELAVQRVPQADLEADVEAARMTIAQRAGELDEAIARADAAVAGYARRGRTAAQLRAELGRLHLALARGRAEDVLSWHDRLEELHARASAHFEPTSAVVQEIESSLAYAMFSTGDVHGAHARLEKLRRTAPQLEPRRLTGRVVDDTGAPVAGARVFTGSLLIGSAVSASTFGDQTLRAAVTGPDGRFEIPDAPAQGVVVAEHAELRSLARRVADSVELVLLPTSRLEGRVELAGKLPQGVQIVVGAAGDPDDVPHELLAPVAADGTFVIDRIWRTRVRLHALTTEAFSTHTTTTIDVREPVVSGITLAVATTARKIHVLVRSTAGDGLGNAQVLVTPGRVAWSTIADVDLERPMMTMRYAQAIQGEQAPPAVLAVARRGDLFASADAPEGEATACALALPSNVSEPDLQARVDRNRHRIEIRCEPVPATSDVVVIDVPPWPRLD